ncbi:thermonuclease family protein [Paracoccus sp. 1_MG-2023]|uniref:thermonuclease family protein n=1 Tax=unclassified Paracoccus (in: a-proteobacteria) TaxID=2688777 RepID=UPI001C08B833|nr:MULTISPECIES: thermonuclease family protein [unclassified Paracoccus (in: a-proteobacteria)]MBU2956802.1 thermonuclease family protein [Paracoccus sp. C2R09]MDO6670438.1 thermonuclease family protein [Paracoccus sp. 1_MG-2023]
MGLLLTCASAAGQNSSITGTANIVDGDTLRLGDITIRIHGIDAPETEQRCSARGGGDWNCGKAATEAAIALAQGHEVTCVARDRDAYGRIVASCEVNGTDIGASLVKRGLAWSYRKYSDDYAMDEEAARSLRVGIWQEDTQTAWDFRSDAWAVAAYESPRKDCPIKGNIAGDGDRIYHTPWSPFYSRTRIDEAKGERWFCNEAEAVAAGWRAPFWK